MAKEQKTAAKDKATSREKSILEIEFHVIQNGPTSILTFQVNEQKNVETNDSRIVNVSCDPDIDYGMDTGCVQRVFLRGFNTTKETDIVLMKPKQPHVTMSSIVAMIDNACFPLKRGDAVEILEGSCEYIATITPQRGITIDTANTAEYLVNHDGVLKIVNWITRIDKTITTLDNRYKVRWER